LAEGDPWNACAWADGWMPAMGLPHMVGIQFGEHFGEGLVGMCNEVLYIWITLGEYSPVQ
jgi:hypothetical protein